MKIYCISDNIDTNIGLRLVGVDGVVVHKREEILKAIEEVKKDNKIGILAITRKLVEKVPEVVDDLKLTPGLPLVVEIPDRHVDKDTEADYLTRYVRESIGIKI